MATMNISLPDKMKEWVEAQTTDGKFGNASDYMRDLIRRDQERQAFVRFINEAVEEGIASGFVPYSREEIEMELGIGRSSDAA